MKAEIELLGLDFFSYHGFYEEERKIGNKYTIDIKVTTNLSFENNNQLDSTINYEILGKIAAEAMGTPTKLLEEIGVNIAQKILQEFNQANEAIVSVRKHNPPIGIVCQNSKVTITLHR
jgi:dihydroneopterin aldolase